MYNTHVANIKWISSQEMDILSRKYDKKPSLAVVITDDPSTSNKMTVDAHTCDRLIKLDHPGDNYILMNHFNSRFIEYDEFNKKLLADSRHLLVVEDSLGVDSYKSIKDSLSTIEYRNRTTNPFITRSNRVVEPWPVRSPPDKCYYLYDTIKYDSYVNRARTLTQIFYKNGISEDISKFSNSLVDILSNIAGMLPIITDSPVICSLLVASGVPARLVDDIIVKSSNDDLVNSLMEFYGTVPARCLSRIQHTVSELSWYPEYQCIFLTSHDSWLSSALCKTSKSIPLSLFRVMPGDSR